MGNIVSTGDNNDDLVDILRRLGYIKTKKIERVFRVVDRGDYVLSSHRDGAYKDLSWKFGNLHLSAPCVYGRVMEGLSLEPGMSFLNIGSGTGYLSTMAGLILSHHGTNHGIELNLDCLEYAYSKLEEFKQKSLALDEFDFCEPVFMHGNCMRLEGNRQYDRVYCGAACPEITENYFKQFVKVGGILVMPYKDHLLRIERLGTDLWRHKAMLPVSFATLVMPKPEDHYLLQLPYSQPLSLQELCRCRIRCELRKSVWSEHPELESRDPITSGTNKSSPPQRPYPHFLVPFYEGSDNRTSNDDEDDPASRTRLLLYFDAHTGEEITNLQVVRAMAPSRNSEYTPNHSPTSSLSLPLRDSNEITDSDEDSTRETLATTSDPLTSNLRNRKFEQLLDDDDSDGDESPKETPKKCRMLVDREYLNIRDDSIRTAHKYFQSAQVDDALLLNSEGAERLLGDRSNENCDKNESSESDNSIQSSDDFAVSSETLTDSNEKNSDLRSTDNGEDDDESGKLETQPKNNLRKLYSQNTWDSGASLNDSEEDELEDCEHHDKEFDRKDGKPEMNNCRKSRLKNPCDRTHQESDEEENCPLMDWSTTSTTLHNEWGIPDCLCSTETGSCSKVTESNNTIARTAQVFAHNVDINAFSHHMKDKISRLPLPLILRLYINYDRVL